MQIHEEHLKKSVEVEEILQELLVQKIRIKGHEEDALALSPKNGLTNKEMIDLLTAALSWALKIHMLDKNMGRSIEILEQKKN